MQMTRESKVKAIYCFGSAICAISILLLTYAKGHCDGRRQGIVECLLVHISALDMLENGEVMRAKRRLSMCVSGSLEYLDSDSPWLRAWETWKPGRTEEFLEKARVRAAEVLMEHKNDDNSFDEDSN